MFSPFLSALICETLNAFRHRIDPEQSIQLQSRSIWRRYLGQFMGFIQERVFFSILINADIIRVIFDVARWLQRFYRQR